MKLTVKMQSTSCSIYCACVCVCACVRVRVQKNTVVAESFLQTVISTRLIRWRLKKGGLQTKGKKTQVAVLRILVYKGSKIIRIPTTNYLKIKKNLKLLFQFCLDNIFDICVQRKLLV